MEADLATNLLPPGPSTAGVSPNYADLVIDNFGVRMGMAPFMVMHLLMHPAAQHCIGYDLESLYHVLIFVLTQIEDFSKTDDQKFCMANLPKPIYKWFSRHLDLETLGKIKTTQFHIYFDRILDTVKPIFHPLVPILSQIWKALYPVSKPARDPPMNCCDDFIHAIEDVILNYVTTGIGQDSGQAGVSNIIVVPEKNPVESRNVEQTSSTSHKKTRTH
ncbi:hypothetical protein H0H87_010815 [Tephrocybe sp. NHM501043]|nr:hypothetical protein H0H87_010815 [Tephrocybe sp. NHM501043]